MSDPKIDPNTLDMIDAGIAAICERLDALIGLMHPPTVVLQPAHEIEDAIKNGDAQEVVFKPETVPYPTSGERIIPNILEAHMENLRAVARNACELCGGMVDHDSTCPLRVLRAELDPPFPVDSVVVARLQAIPDSSFSISGDEITYQVNGREFNPYSMRFVDDGSPVTWTRTLGSYGFGARSLRRSKTEFVKSHGRQTGRSAQAQLDDYRAVAESMQMQEVEVTDEMIQAYYGEYTSSPNTRTGRESVRAAIKAAIEKMPRRVAMHPAIGAAYTDRARMADENIVLRWMDQAKDALWMGQHEDHMDAYMAYTGARDAMLRLTEHRDKPATPQRDETMVRISEWMPALPQWLLDSAREIESYMLKHHNGPWAIGGIQKRSEPPPCPSLPPNPPRPYSALREHVRATDADERDAAKWRGLMAEVEIMPTGELAHWIAVLKSWVSGPVIPMPRDQHHQQFTRLRCLLEVIFNEHEKSKKGKGNGTS